jgi:hypothetical protein
MMFDNPYMQSYTPSYGGYGQQQFPSQTFPTQSMAPVPNQKPKKVIYIDLQGNQKVYLQREDGNGYSEDQGDERNLNAENVKPVLDIENYDGVQYREIERNE